VRPSQSRFRLCCYWVVLGAAVIRPFGWPEAVFAVPAAVILVGAGAVFVRRCA